MTAEDIKAIREAYVPRKVAHKSPNVMELAKKYGVSQETIRKIALRKTYRWVN